MQKILGTVADFNHIAHPLKKPNLTQSRKPTVLERIAGVICLVLTVPFTLGILTGFYFYWAKRKVALIDNSRAEKVHQVVTQIYGQAVGSPEAQLVSNAARTLLSGKRERAANHLESLANSGQLTSRVKEALLGMVITNNQVDIVEELAGRFVSNDFPLERFPLYKARTGEMVNELVRLGVPVDCRDEKGSAALHHAPSIEVARALVRNGSKFWEIEDKDKLTPLNTVTNAEILKAIMSETLEVREIPQEVRLKASREEYLKSFGNSLEKFIEITMNEEPGRETDMGNLKANMKALLACLGPEEVAEQKYLMHTVIKSSCPEILSLLIDAGAKINTPEWDNLCLALGILGDLEKADPPSHPKTILEAKKVVEILIDKGADVNRPDNWESSLELCLKIGDPELLKKFIEKEVQLVPNRAGETPVEQITDILVEKLRVLPGLEQQIDDVTACMLILLEKIDDKLGDANKEFKEFMVLNKVVTYNASHKIVSALVNKKFQLKMDSERLLLDTAFQSYNFFSTHRGLQPDEKKKRIDNLNKIVEILINSGAEASYDNLISAIFEGDPVLVDLILKIVPADGGDPDRDLPLQRALENVRNAVWDRVSEEEIEAKKEVVRVLVKKGASLTNMLSHLRNTPELDDIHKLLTEKGAT